MNAQQHSTERDEEPIPRWAQTWMGRDINGKEVPYADVHEMIHRDVSTGNEYRRERIKHLITVAVGVFALTVTFHKDLFHEPRTAATIGLLLAGWSMLLLSLLMGIIHLRAWENFHLAFLDIGHAVWKNYAAGEEPARADARGDYHGALKKRAGGKRAFRFYDVGQTTTLLLGLGCIALYVYCSGVR